MYELPYFKKSVKLVIDTEKGMIAEVEYTIRRALPGKNEYDYEIIRMKSIQDETEEPRTGEKMLKEVMSMSRQATAAYQANLKARSAE